MASWSTFIRPDYSTRYNQPLQQHAINEVHAPLPAIRVAIPKTSFQAPKNGLPVNPSPHPSTDPAVQAPIGGRASPAFVEPYRSPVLEQREYLSPRDISPARYIDWTQNHNKTIEATAISRSSSQTSLDGGCQHCECCRRRRKGHARSNSYDSIASSMASSTADLSSASPNMSSTPAVDQKRASSFRHTFKFLQRSSSLEVHGTKDSRSRDSEKARKRSTSITAKKKPQPKKVIFEMVTEDDHWADE